MSLHWQVDSLPLIRLRSPGVSASLIISKFNAIPNKILRRFFMEHDKLIFFLHEYERVKKVRIPELQQNREPKQQLHG